MNTQRIFIDNIALLGAMSSQNHAPANGNGRASRREIFQHLIEGLRREELTGLLAHETGTHAGAWSRSNPRKFSSTRSSRLHRAGTREVS